MESGSVSFHLPVKPYLKKYLLKKYGESFVVSRNSWLGSYLIEMMDKEYRKVNSQIDRESSYELIIPTSIVVRKGFDISTAKMKLLNEMIRKIFVNDLSSYIEVSMCAKLHFKNEKHKSYNKQNAMQAIYQFLEFYGIEEGDLKVESLYRDYQRQRESDEDKGCKNQRVA